MMSGESGEIILTTEETGKLWSACVWDPSTGTVLKTYEGAGAAGPRAACFLGKDYLLLSDNTRPILNAWPLNSPNPIKSETFDCTGKVNAMAATPDGFFVVTAVGKKVIVWQTASGAELIAVERHFQPVTCIKFTHDGSHFISGGEDGQVLVWRLAYLASLYCGESFPDQSEPRYSFWDNGLPIQDIFVGFGGMKARFVTVSLDKSCRLYDLIHGRLMATIVLSYSLSAVAMIADESKIFVGATTGKIFQLDIVSRSRTREHHVTYEDKGKVFDGHSKMVTCLSVSQDGKMLLSGSNDQQVILWEISDREIIRTIKHEGAITNAFFAIAPLQMFSDKFEPVLVLCSFRKIPKGQMLIKVRTTEDHYKPPTSPTEDLAFGFTDLEAFDFTNLGAFGFPNLDAFGFPKMEDKHQTVTDEQEEKDQLRDAGKKNYHLYNLAVERLFKALNVSEEERANEEGRMKAEGESSNSKDSKCKRKKKAQDKHKVTKK